MCEDSDNITCQICIVYKLSGKDRNLVLPCMQDFMGYDFTFEPLKKTAVLRAGNLVLKSKVKYSQSKTRNLRKVRAKY